MFSKLKQFKDLRDQAKSIQSKLSEHSAEGSAAWGKVKVTMNGNLEVTAATIDPELLAPENKTKIEAAVKEATNDVIKKMQRVMAETVQKMGGLDLPK
jgi:DNA-binding YbaB/EbfC family protein